MKSIIKSTSSTDIGKCFSRGRPSTGAVSMINKTQSGGPAGWVGGVQIHGAGLPAKVRP